MKTIQPVRLLKFALYADAAASLSLGLLQLMLPSLLADTLSLPTALLTGTGLFLIGYTVSLVLLASARQVWAAAVQFIVIGNVGWAVACLALAASALVSPSTLGIGFLLFQAVAVLLFACFEHTGLRESMWDAPSQKLQCQ